MLAAIDHHRWIERRGSLKALQADQELKRRIPLDLFNEFFILGPKTGLDEQCTQCHAKGFCRFSKALAKLSRVVGLQLVPWNQFSELDPTLVSRELPSEWQKEILNRELIMMHRSEHMENSGQLFGANKPVSKQLISDTAQNQSHKVVLTSSGRPNQQMTTQDLTIKGSKLDLMKKVSLLSMEDSLHTLTLFAITENDIPNSTRSTSTPVTPLGEALSQHMHYSLSPLAQESGTYFCIKEY